MLSNTSIKSRSKHVLQHLIRAHRLFQEQLDVITSACNDVAVIEALIQIRAFNVDCITRYSDIIAKTAMKFQNQTSYSALFSADSEPSQALWNININLSRLIPVYSACLATTDLNSISRMIIARNLERIVYIKDNLLHPIPADKLV